MRRNLFIVLTAALVLFIVTIPVQAVEPDRCVTIIPTDQNTPYVGYELIERDEGLAASRVGHYMWLQNVAGEPSADHSLVSIDLNTLPAGEVTVCTGDTSYTEAEQPTIETVVDEPTEREWVVPASEPRVLRVWVPL